MSKSPKRRQRVSSSSDKDDASSDGKSKMSKSPSPPAKNSSSTSNKTSRPPFARPPGAKKPKGHRGGSGGWFGNFVRSPMFTLSACFVASVLSAIIVYYLHRYYIYLPSLVNTPSTLPKVLADDHFDVAKSPDLFWGTYDANPYFAMRTRSPDSLVIGLIWFAQPKKGEQLLPKFRHWCSPPPDSVSRYGWLEHDGRTFGVQEIIDDGLQIRISFVKRPGGQNGGDWTARIDAETLPEFEAKDNASLYSFVVYALRRGDGNLRPKIVKDSVQRGQVNYVDAVQGETSTLGKFQLSFSPASPENLISRSFVSLAIDSPNGIKILDALVENMGVIRVESKSFDYYLSLMGGNPNTPEDSHPTNPNLLAMQTTVLRRTSFEIVFESGSNNQRRNRLLGNVYDQELKKRRTDFEERFEKLFGLKEKQYADIYINTGKLALSNMLGSISFFHGYNRVISEYNRKPVSYGPLTLFSTIPSRPFFPRGFLWDEGFHQLLVARWDKELSLEILSSWLDLMNVEGWIPREVILGPEAESKVPAEFIIQHNDVANPPMFFYVLNALMKRHDAKKDAAFNSVLSRMYPRLKLWYQWLNTTQVGELPDTYRWRGRNTTTMRELNPKTLPSGLDDYPRASHPSKDEYHVDLYCWMALSSKTMADISELLGDSEKANYKTTSDRLHSFSTLNSLHYSDKAGRYCDYGSHTRHVGLERPKVELTPDGRPKMPVQQELIRITKSDPQNRLVTDAFGYVSLFPLIMRMVPADSPKLESLLKQVQDPTLTWSPYGLRSLAKASAWYKQRNTEHDPPYWRGDVWLNVNYLVLSSLHYYTKLAGPHRELAYETYGKLRSVLVANVVKEYRRTGFLWERYDDENGKGIGTHPFTGWTSLIVLMMAEEYD